MGRNSVAQYHVIINPDVPAEDQASQSHFRVVPPFQRFASVADQEKRRGVKHYFTKYSRSESYPGSEQLESSLSTRLDTGATGVNTIKFWEPFGSRPVREGKIPPNNQTHIRLV